MKILLADDDRIYCFTLKKHLQKNKDYKISIVFDGNEAKHYVENDTYDVIFLDCDMPYLSGVDLIRIIKRENPGAAIIMISGYRGIEKNFAKRAGVVEFLRKPFPIKRVVEILNKYEPRK